ncbi:hypothetical protein [Vulcanisaeta distributa]|uniref:DedA family protein n=1 Tax=Vulcanisaeta distributa TaxID=164451 RepID=UPI001FB45DA4|nr:hypothetical protein [Vulcanisaeta distributa]
MMFEYAFKGLYGYALVFVLMVLEGMSLPIPSEVVMPLVGYYASLGFIDPVLGVLIGTFGSLIGSLIDYYIAYYLGIPFLLRYGGLFGLDRRRLNSLVGGSVGMVRWPCLALGFCLALGRSYHSRRAWLL